MAVDWRELRLGDVCELKYGKSLPKAKRSGEGFAVFGSNGQIGRHKDALTSGKTIIVGRKGSLGEVTFSYDRCWAIDTTYYIDESATTADLRWLYYRMKAMPLTLLNRAAAVPGLNREDAYSQPLLLPPIEEQRQIADVLDAADSLRAKRQLAITKLDSLTQAIFVDMFGDPRILNQNEEDVVLGDHVALFSGSTLPDGVEFDTQTDGYALVKVSDLARDGNEKYLKSTREWSLVRGSTASTCPPGSVVIPKRGGAIATNRKRITTTSSVLDPNLMGIAPNSDSLELAYLYGWLELLDLASIQSGSSVPQLNKKDLAPLKLRLPPIESQVKYAQLVDVADVCRSQMAEHLYHLDTLFASLRQRAFRGEL